MKLVGAQKPVIMIFFSLSHSVYLSLNVLVFCFLIFLVAASHWVLLSPTSHLAAGAASVPGALCSQSDLPESRLCLVWVTFLLTHPENERLKRFSLFTHRINSTVFIACEFWSLYGQSCNFLCPYMCNLSLPGLLKAFFMCLDVSVLKGRLSFLFWNYFSIGWQHGKWIIHHVGSTLKIHFCHSGYFRMLPRILNCFIILALLFLKSTEHKTTITCAPNSVNLC